jgi:hypothetical protein
MCRRLLYDPSPPATMLQGTATLQRALAKAGFAPQSRVRDLYADNFDRPAARPHGFAPRCGEAITNKARDCFGCESMGEHESLSEAARGVGEYLWNHRITLRMRSRAARALGDINCLYVHKLFDAVDGKLPSVAAFLDAAERESRVGAHGFVDEDATTLNPFGSDALAAR